MIPNVLISVTLPLRLLWWKHHLSSIGATATFMWNLRIHYIFLLCSTGKDCKSPPSCCWRFIPDYEEKNGFFHPFVGSRVLSIYPISILPLTAPSQCKTGRQYLPVCFIWFCVSLGFTYIFLSILNYGSYKTNIQLNCAIHHVK